jgi:hypothetical protein
MKNNWLFTSDNNYCFIFRKYNCPWSHLIYQSPTVTEVTTTEQTSPTTRLKKKYTNHKTYILGLALYIIQLEFLIDNIFVIVGGRIFKQRVGIPLIES